MLEMCSVKKMTDDIRSSPCYADTMVVGVPVYRVVINFNKNHKNDTLVQEFSAVCFAQKHLGLTLRFLPLCVIYEENHVIEVLLFNIDDL